MATQGGWNLSQEHPCTFLGGPHPGSGPSLVGPSRANSNYRLSLATSFLPKKIFVQMEWHLIGFKMTSNRAVSSIPSLVTLRLQLRCRFGGLAFG